MYCMIMHAFVDGFTFQGLLFRVIENCKILFKLKHD